MAVALRDIVKYSYEAYDLMPLERSKIQYLDLSDQILEFGALQKVIQDCPNLRFLDLRKIAIYNDQMEIVAGLNSITNLYLPIDYYKLAPDRASQIKFITDGLDPIAEDPIAEDVISEE